MPLLIAEISTVAMSSRVPWGGRRTGQIVLRRLKREVVLVRADSVGIASGRVDHRRLVRPTIGMTSLNRERIAENAKYASERR